MAAAVASVDPPAAPADDDTPDCGICLDKVAIRGQLDSCEHPFCFDCIFKWSQVTNTCPMCKQRFYELRKITDASQEVTNQPKPAEVDQKAPKRRNASRAASSRKRKRSDANVDENVVHIPHRDQRSDHYQANLADVMEVINGVPAPVPGLRIPLMGLLGMPFFFRGRRRSRPTGPISIDDDDANDHIDYGDDDSDDDVRRPRAGHHVRGYFRRRMDDDIDHDNDDESDMELGGYHAAGMSPGRILLQHLFAQLAERDRALRRPPPPPAAPLRHIVEGDRTIIDLTEDDDVLPAAPTRLRTPPTMNATPITVLDDGDNDGDDDVVIMHSSDGLGARAPVAAPPRISRRDDEAEIVEIVDTLVDNEISPMLHSESTRTLVEGSESALAQPKEPNPRHSDTSSAAPNGASPD